MFLPPVPALAPAERSRTSSQRSATMFRTPTFWVAVLLIVCVVAPYLLGVPPRSRRDWMLLVATVAFLAWLLVGLTSLRAEPDQQGRREVKNPLAGEYLACTRLHGRWRLVRPEFLASPGERTALRLADGGAEMVI
jgi:hypothetical protein